MTGHDLGAGRLDEAIRGLPGGLVARPAAAEDVPGIVEVMRAVDVAGCGHSEANITSVAEELAGPDVRWGEGASVVLRDAAIVAIAMTYDGLATGRGWDVDVYVHPEEPDRLAVLGALVDAGVALGRHRHATLVAAAPGQDAAELDPAVAAPVTRSFCLAADTATREVLEARGFVERRRYWQMRIDHDGVPAVPVPPDGYRFDIARSEAEHRGVHAVSNAAFADHYDSTPLPFELWHEFMTGATWSPEDWTIAVGGGGGAGVHGTEDGDRAGAGDGDGIVGFAVGSDRFASEAAGYVASLGVLPEHRGRGLATALLQARFAADAARGFTATLLHCDSENLTGATRIYEAAGMRVDHETVAFHRPLLG